MLSAARTVLLGVVVALVAGVLTAVAVPLALTPAPARAASVYGAPSWWNGDCDTVNWTAKARAAGWTGEAARRLGGNVLGIPVCGPRNLAGAPNVSWSRKGWGELEWQCVEFAQRFMVQVYGVEPYGANGVDVVSNYRTSQGGGLVRINNGTVGTAPQPGDVMSFSSPSNVYGHVAVVASTSVDAQGNGSIRLATQNDTPDGWRTLSVSGWKVAAFGSLYPYAWLHDPLHRGDGGVAGDTSIQEGTFVSYAGVTYRIAGGAPLPVTTAAAVGGTSGVVAVDAARFATLRTVPRDGTFLRDPASGARWRVAGGAALPMTDCTAAGMDMCSGWVDIDPAAVKQAGGTGTWSHLRSTIADGTFLRVGDDGAVGLGTLGRAAGGAVLPVADCDDIGGCGSWVTVQAATWTAYRAAHRTPVDGTVVRLQPSGRFGSYSGGKCAVVAGTSGRWTDVPDRAVACASPLALAAPAPPVLVQKRSASAKFVASGGTAPYRWSVVGGALPLGTTLGTTGAVSGTPTTAGASTFTVQVTDAAGATATAAATWAVAPPVAVVTPAPGPLQAGTSAWVVLQATGGTGGYTWTALDALPAGLVVTSDGVVAGTPTTAGTTTVRFRATDAGAPAYSAVGTLTLVVVR